MWAEFCKYWVFFVKSFCKFKCTVLNFKSRNPFVLGFNHCSALGLSVLVSQILVVWNFEIHEHVGFECSFVAFSVDIYVVVTIKRERERDDW